jgi:hypothetical protein
MAFRSDFFILPLMEENIPQSAQSSTKALVFLSALGGRINNLQKHNNQLPKLVHLLAFYQVY